MSVYFDKKRKKWRYDFTQKGQRYPSRNFTTKAEAKAAEAEERRVLKQLKTMPEMEETPIAMDFLTLINGRMDHVQNYNSERYYTDTRYLAKRWIREWGNLECESITKKMVREFLISRKKDVSAHTANMDLRYLRAAFNWGIKEEMISFNPCTGIERFPEEKGLKYVPPREDVDRVILIADPEKQDYLWIIRDTLARVGEINRLRWNDVNLTARTITLFTKKKRGGHLTPRTIEMTERVFQILSRRFEKMDSSKPWVFWHRSWSRKKGLWIDGPYQYRKTFMKTLCKDAGVKHFGFHALRHLGASIMANANVPIIAIQEILGHETVTTTQNYLRSLGCVKQDAIRAYENATRTHGEALAIYERLTEKSHTNPHTDVRRGYIN